MVNAKIKLITFSVAKDGELYTVSKNKTWSWLWVNHHILITKFRLKLKKAGKTTRPAKYILNQISYEHAMEVINRFKGVDLGSKILE